MLRKDPEKRPSVQELMAHAALRPEMEAARARALELAPGLQLPPLLGPWLPAAGSDASESGGGSGSGGGGSAREGESPRGSLTEEDDGAGPSR
jgi:hypothetical protein